MDAASADDEPGGAGAELELVAVDVGGHDEEERAPLTGVSNRSHRASEPLASIPRGALRDTASAAADEPEHRLLSALRAAKAARRREACCPSYTYAQLGGLALGPALAAALSFVPLSDAHPKAQLMLGQVAWIASWWLSLALPLPVTCLLPIVTFPLLGITPCAEISSVYFNSVIFLFIGAIIVDHGIEKTELHKRLALRIILGMGTSPRMQLLAMMLVTAALSAFCSNSSTTLMMVPFVLGVIEHAEADAQARARQNPHGDGCVPAEEAAAVRGYGRGLLIGVAWAASIGGSATLIGTAGPPILATYYAEHYPESAVPLNFGTWSAFAGGISILLFLAAFAGVAAVFCRSQHLVDLDRAVLQGELAALGPLRRDERVVACAQIFQVVLWFLRGLLLVRLAGNCSSSGPGDAADGTTATRGACLAAGGVWTSPFSSYDAGIACAGAMVLFIAPSADRPGERILDWAYVNAKMPWDILLLLGGGFAISRGFVDSGLSLVITEALAGLRGMPLTLSIAVITLVTTFLTELTSNAATASIMVPVLASAAEGLGIHPLALLLPGTYAAGCAFMLPIATPPNAIVYATHRLQFSSMMGGGFFLNLLACIVIVLFTQTVAKGLFGGGTWEALADGEL